MSEIIPREEKTERVSAVGGYGWVTCICMKGDCQHFYPHLLMSGGAPLCKCCVPPDFAGGDCGGGAYGSALDEGVVDYGG